ncbi:heat shock 70 kDa protein 12B-like [Mercenaria mercenaria]|uniref:heat shock 70 kDa protein 12B-like n=1 Tax=Mercenaria mercenaria TaxID=6596 RepID=UPI00234ECC53|nr:heat shock 70 kDa protein 12B-like [Mercenaria mercenaria]
MIAHVKGILAEKKMKNVISVLLVGGFGESKLVQKEMQERIQNKRIIIPNEAGLVVLKGAVRFGHSPDIISSRIMSYSYGFKISEKFDERKHPKNLIYHLNGRELVDKVFYKIVEAGEEIQLGQDVTDLRNPCTPTSYDRTVLKVYRSTEAKPKFVNDRGCSLLGQLIIDHKEGKSLKDKKFSVNVAFGDTEVFVKAKLEKSGTEFSTYIECLEN